MADYVPTKTLSKVLAITFFLAQDEKSDTNDPCSQYSFESNRITNKRSDSSNTASLEK